MEVTRFASFSGPCARSLIQIFTQVIWSAKQQRDNSAKGKRCKTELRRLALSLTWDHSTTTVQSHLRILETCSKAPRCTPHPPSVSQAKGLQFKPYADADCSGSTLVGNCYHLSNQGIRHITSMTLSFQYCLHHGFLPKVAESTWNIICNDTHTVRDTLLPILVWTLPH